MTQQDCYSRLAWWQVPLLFLASLSPLLPNWLDPRLPATHEGYRYLLLSDWFLDALSAGVWYPRWLPDMNGGFGYPEFVFYQPAYFFLNAAISLVAEPLFLRQLLTLSILALLGGLGVYLLARRFTSSGYALVLVLLFQIAPYVHTNLFQRGDLSEWMVLELLPWPVFFLLRLCPEKQGYSVLRRMIDWLGLAISTAILCYCHPVAVMFVPPLLACIGILCLLRGKPAPPLLAYGELAGAIGFGLALSSPYWLTVMQMKPYVNVTAVLDGFVAANNTVEIRHLLFGSLYNESVREYVGFPFVLAALLGWWRGRKHPAIFAAGLLYLMVVLLITPAGQWFWRIYPFSLLQFPWRLAVFVPLLQVLCFLGLTQSLLEGYGRTNKGLFATIICLLVLWSWHGHFGFRPAETPGSPVRFDQQSLACLSSFAQTGRPGRYVTTLDAAEWLPRSAMGIMATPARGTLVPGCKETQQAMAGLAQQIGMPGLYDLHPSPRPLLEVAEQGWRAQPAPGSSGFRLDYRLSGAQPATITINQVYLPGWRVVLNGLQVSREELERQLLPDGRMRLALSPGEWQVQAWYDGPPGWRLQNLVLLGVCLMVMSRWFILWYRAVKYSQSKR